MIVTGKRIIDFHCFIKTAQNTAGAILMMLSNTMMPEACAHGGKLAGLYRPRFFRFSPCRFDRENMMNSYFAQLRCFTWIFSITMIYCSNTIAADDH